MKIYLVGGAVRDRLLGLPIKEKDWVVVGATVNDMLQLGFRQVGKDFPVFLHPKTKEEYALARKERKTGKGYTAFAFDASPTVTLEEDLLRRDITINAMAMTEDGALIDPYHGQEDLKKQLLRHVSPAFAEDPVRILRIARFAARFNFDIAPETYELMRNMVGAGEVDALVAERVWKECERALQEKNPAAFFMVLNACGAAKILFPMLQIPGKGLDALVESTRQTNNSSVRFAALFYQHHTDDIQSLSNRYKIPHEYRDLAILVSRHYPTYLKANQLTAAELTEFFQQLDAFRREERFQEFLLTCQSIGAFSSDFLNQCNAAAKDIDIQKHIEHLEGKQIAEKIKALRIEAIEKYLSAST